MFSVPVVKSNEPLFSQTVERYPRLVKLIDKPPAKGTYLYFSVGKWFVVRVGNDGYLRRAGAYEELHTAVYIARK